jgi:Flp pilus assembly protein TadG
LITLNLNQTPQMSVQALSRVERLLARLRDGGEDGSSLIEFAVCMPVLLLILTGTFAFGIALNNYLMLTNATTIGAQQLSISRGQTTDPCATTSSAIIAASPLLKATSFNFAYVINGVSYSGTSCSSGSTTTGAAGNLLQGVSAKVTVTYPCNLAVYGANIVPNCSLKAQLTEMVQ